MLLSPRGNQLHESKQVDFMRLIAMKRLSERSKCSIEFELTCRLACLDQLQVRFPVILLNN